MEAQEPVVVSQSSSSPMSHVLHPDLDSLMRAVLYGLVGLNERDQDHLRNERCSQCERSLHRSWDRNDVPEAILRRTNVFHPDGAFGAALREHIVSCQRCLAMMGEKGIRLSRANDEFFAAAFEVVERHDGLRISQFEVTIAILSGPSMLPEAMAQHLLHDNCRSCRTFVYAALELHPLTLPEIDKFMMYPSEGILHTALKEHAEDLRSAFALISGQSS